MTASGESILATGGRTACLAGSSGMFYPDLPPPEDGIFVSCRQKIAPRPRLALVAALLGIALFFADAAALAKVEKKRLLLSDDTEMFYSVVTPDGYDGKKALPAILAFPGGDQQSVRVAWGLQHYWRTEAEARGYLLVSPQSPGFTFIESTWTRIPEFLERIKILFRVRNDRFHLVGVGIGGMSAFQVAAFYPDYFVSILTIPGHVWAPSEEKYQALRGLCIVQIVGAPEVKWVDGARRDHAKFREMGMNPFLEILPGKVHWRSPYIDGGAGGLFDMIENRTGC